MVNTNFSFIYKLVIRGLTWRFLYIKLWYRLCVKNYQILSFRQRNGINEVNALRLSKLFETALVFNSSNVAML